MADSGEETHGPGVVHAWGQDHQQVVDEQRLVLEVELKGLVIQFNVGHLGDDVLEEALLPGLSGMAHHG